MLQRGGIYPTMTASQVIRLYAKYYEGREDPDAVIELLDLGRVAGTAWRRLSGGEQQRVSLALALVGRPDVAFLDEPTAGVDPQGRVVIRDVISQLAGRGAAVVLTTHELAEAERAADRLIILANGKSIAEGTLEQLAGLAGAPGHPLRGTDGHRLRVARRRARGGAGQRHRICGGLLPGRSRWEPDQDRGAHRVARRAGPHGAEPPHRRGRARGCLHVPHGAHDDDGGERVTRC